MQHAFNHFPNCSHLFHLKVLTLQAKMSVNRAIDLHFLTILTQTLEDAISFCKRIGLMPQEVKWPS